MGNPTSRGEGGVNVLFMWTENELPQLTYQITTLTNTVEGAMVYRPPGGGAVRLCRMSAVYRGKECFVILNYQLWTIRYDSSRL